MTMILTAPVDGKTIQELKAGQEVLVREPYMPPGMQLIKK
jgi:hypothetical protein